MHRTGSTLGRRTIATIGAWATIDWMEMRLIWDCVGSYGSITSTCGFVTCIKPYTWDRKCGANRTRPAGTISGLKLNNHLAVALDNAIGNDLAALDRYLALLRQRQ